MDGAYYVYWYSDNFDANKGYMLLSAFFLNWMSQDAAVGVNINMLIMCEFSIFSMYLFYFKKNI